MSEYQSRYVAYARAHGRAPSEMLAHDRAEFPGGAMAGYVIWIGRKWREWFALNGGRPADYYAHDEDHKRFDEWLATQ